MPNTPNASFIPKQGTAKRVRQTASKQVHILNIVSYVLFVATLIAAGGVFLYNRHLNNQLNSEVEKLSAAIGGFSSADMEAVREFNIRLHQAQGRLDKSISITSLLGALEDATLKSAAIMELSIKRENDTQVAVTAKVETDSFDGSIFQRGVFERNAVIKDVVLSDVTLNQATKENAKSSVSFIAKINVPLQDIPYKVSGAAAVATPPTSDSIPTKDISASSSATTSTNGVN
jgi:hypothetical protein